MRFAEKMLLNAKFYGLVAGKRHDASGNRCALGLVEEGISGLMAQRYAEILYPWLRNAGRHTPCVCRGFAGCVNGIIAHIFNEHVMGDKTWTLEKLADWIESVDPTPREVHASETNGECSQGKGPIGPSLEEVTAVTITK